MKDKDLLKLLIKNGWSKDRVNGSHYIMKKGSRIISLPVHGKELKTGIAAAILKQAGLK